VKPHSVPHLRTDGTAKLKLIEARFKRAAANSTRRDAATGDMTNPDERLLRLQHASSVAGATAADATGQWHVR
jgi:hypothetical protein